MASIEEDIGKAARAAKTTLNFLMPTGGNQPTKSYMYDEEAKAWKKHKSYKAGMYFNGFEVPVNSLEDVYSVLDENQEAPCFMIHGKFLPGTDLAGMVRRKRTGGDIAPTIGDRLVHCFCFDIDGYTGPAGANVEKFIELELPDAFHKADYVKQWSASHGLTTGPGELKVHLFFWLEEPLMNEDIRAWIQSYNTNKDWGHVIDASVLVATQPVYTQRRECIGGDDPIGEILFHVRKSGSLKWAPGDIYEVRHKGDHTPRAGEGGGGNLSHEALACPSGNLTTLVSGSNYSKASDFNLGLAAKEIVAGKRFHENVRSMSLSFMNDGMPARKVKEAVKGIMNAVHFDEQDDRWRERFADIDRLVESAEEIVDNPSYEDFAGWITKSPPLVVQEGFAERLIKFDPIQQELLAEAVRKKIKVGKRAITKTIGQALVKDSDRRKAIAMEIKDEQIKARGLTALTIEADKYGEITKAAAFALAKSKKKPQIFRVGNGLGIVVPDTPRTVHQVMSKKELGDDYPMMPIIRSIGKDVGSIRGELEKVVSFTNEKKKAMLCPSEILLGVTKQSDAPFMPLTGIVEHPYLSLDFKVKQRQGYDPETGLFSAMNNKMKLARMSPKEAYEYLANEVFDEFPFDAELDRACAVGALLSAVQRPIISGNNGMPGFAMVSPKPSSGKTTLVQLISHAVLNRPAAATSWSDNDEEMGKHLLSILREGHAMVLFDNIPKGGAIDSNELAKAMTSGTYSKRKLGENETETVPSNVLWLFTGNNIVFKGDYTTRMCACKIVPNMEHPEARTFDRKDIGAWASKNRNKILSAAISIIYSGRNRKPKKGDPCSRFPLWDKMVMLPLLDASGKDITGVFRRNAIENDDHGDKITLLRELFKEFGIKEFKTKEVIEVISGYNDTGAMDSSGQGLKDAIIELFDTKATESTKSLGRKLKVIKDNQAGGLKLIKVSKQSGTNWQITVNEEAKKLVDLAFGGEEADE